MIFKFRKQNNSKTIAKSKLVSGFTLIEVMVSISIFAIVVLVSMTAVLSIVDANKKAQVLDDVINNMNFSVESMVRDLRTGYQYNCLETNSNGSCKSIKFSSSISGCSVTYSWDGSKTINKNETACQGGGNSDQALTSSNITVNRFDLFISNLDASQHTQPIILMILQAVGRVGKQTTEFDLQTLISQRKLNI